jgi:hypothetical protein
MIYLCHPFLAITSQKMKKMADMYLSEDHFNNISFPPQSPWQASLFIDHNVGAVPGDGEVDSQVTAVYKKSE